MQNFMEQNNWKLLAMSKGRQILNEKLCNSKTIYHSNAQTYMANRWALEIVMHNFLPLSRSILFTLCVCAIINTALYGSSAVLCAAMAHKIETLLKLETRNCDCTASHYFTLHRRIRSMFVSKSWHTYRARELEKWEFCCKKGRVKKRGLNVNK